MSRAEGARDFSRVPEVLLPGSNHLRATKVGKRSKRVGAIERFWTASSLREVVVEVRQEESQMAGAKRMTKAQVIGEIALFSELDKKSVNKMFEALTDLIKKQLGPRGPGEF